MSRHKYKGPRRSGLEDRVAARLKELGVRFTYEEHSLEYWKPIRDAVCFECEGAQVYKRCWYTPDFHLPDYGITLEVKGKFGQVDRMKMRLVKEAHPDENILMVFDRNNLIGRKAVTKTRYTEYAEKHGLPAVLLSDLTEEWLDEHRA